MIVTRGLGSPQLVLQGYGDFGTHSDLSIDLTPAQVWPFTEAKPSDGYTLEAVPTLPAVGDGLWSDGTSDGFYDEYPSEGFYAKEGYDPEPKPLRRATQTLEGVPS